MHVFNAGHNPGVGVAVRVIGLDPGGGSQVDEQVRLHQIEQKAAQGVVVAELQFLHGHGIVFINNGDDPPGKEAPESVTGV